MENGTKAILIGVSVFITIITFTIVAVLYNGNQTIAKLGAKNIEQSDINYHNGQFSTYYAKDLSVSETKILISKILSNNEKIENKKEDRYIVDLYIDNKSVATILPTVYVDSNYAELRNPYLILCTVTANNMQIISNGISYNIENYVVSPTALQNLNQRVAIKKSDLQRFLGAYIETLGTVFTVDKFTSDDDNITTEIWIETVR